MVAAKDVKLLLLGKGAGSLAAGLLRPGAARHGSVRFGDGGAAWGGGALRGTDFTVGSDSALSPSQAAGSLGKAQSSNR